MDEAIFKDGSSWFYSEDPSYFIPEASLLVDDIEQVPNGDITSPALLIKSGDRYGIYFHIRSSGMGYGAVFENPLPEPFPFTDLDEIHHVIEMTHSYDIVSVLKKKVASETVTK